MLLVDVSVPGWEVIWANAEACMVSGGNAEGASLWSLFAMPGEVSCASLLVCSRYFLFHECILHSDKAA